MAGPPRYVSSRDLLSATCRQSITPRDTLFRLAMPERETTQPNVTECGPSGLSRRPRSCLRRWS
jgi:hypothetical protein